MDSEKQDKYISILKKVAIGVVLWILFVKFLAQFTQHEVYEAPKDQPSKNIDEVQNTTTDIGGQTEPKHNDFLKNARRYAVDEKYRPALIEYKNALQKDAQNGEALLGVAVCLMNLNKPKESQKYLEKAAEVSPWNPEIHIMLADLNRRSGNTASALKHAKKAIELGSQDAETFMLAGILHGEKGDFDSATSFLEKAMKVKPDLMGARAYYARYLRLQGRKDEAKEQVSDILKTEPDLLQAKLEKIALSSRGKPFEYFHTQYDELIKERPSQRARILTHKMQTLFLMRNYDQTLSTALQIISIRPNDGRAHKVCDRIYQRMGLFSKAVEHNQALLRLNSKDISTYQNLARAYVSMGDNKSALKIIDRGLMIDPDDFILLILKGTVLGADTKYELALAFFKKASERKPDSPVPHTYMGRQYLMLGDKEEAIKCYERALEINPDAPIAANNLAVLLLAQDRDIDRAVKLSESLGKRYPNNAKMMDTFGWAYYKQGKIDSAIEKLNTAHSLLPGHPGIMYHLAVVYEKKGNKSNAVEYLKKALKSPARFLEKEAARNLLEKLSQDS